MKPLLEILIPTFNRSESAEAAIESVIDCNDQRLTVRCNSNGYEPNLEKFRNFDSRVKYDCFEYNKGPHANSKKLFNETNAKFCMLLSDEDRVNNMNYEDLLKYLQNNHLAGAALDTFDIEPLPAEHPLRKLNNVTLTPHIAGASIRTI